MPRGKKLVRPSEQSRAKARKAYKDEGKAMHQSYKGPCLIPALPDDGFKETDGVSGCHVIGGRFLEPIANSQRQVCTWNMNAHQVGKNAVHSEWEITERSATPRFEPFKPEKVSINSYLCKSMFACQPHNDKVFKAINAPKTFDTHELNHQFKLGLRAIAGALANTVGVLAYCNAVRNRYLNHEYVKREAKRNHISLITYKNYVQSFLESLEKPIQESGAREKILSEELREWQCFYVSPAERQIFSCHLLARARIGVAISAVSYPKNRPVAICTVLPRQAGQPEENLCDIILTSRQPENRFLRLLSRQDSHLEVEAQKIKALLEGDPAEGLFELLRALPMDPTTFFFVSPDDYYNDEIISDAGRSKVEQDIALIANQRVPR